MVVLENVAEFQARLPAELQAVDNTEPLEYLDVPINSGLVVLRQAANKFIESQGRVVL